MEEEKDDRIKEQQNEDTMEERIYKSRIEYGRNLKIKSRRIILL